MVSYSELVLNIICPFPQCSAVSGQFPPQRGAQDLADQTSGVLENCCEVGPSVPALRVLQSLTLTSATQVLNQLQGLLDNDSFAIMYHCSHMPG